jgi:hypothetical protein
MIREFLQETADLGAGFFFRNGVLLASLAAFYFATWAAPY